VTTSGENCNHDEIVTEMASRICIKCGYEIDKELNYDKEWRFYQNKESKIQNDTTRCHMRKNDTKTIHKDLENLGFNNKIINTANDLYQKVTQGKIYRGNSRKSIVFACVFSAFKIHNNPQTCENLIRIFNLKRKIGLKGLKHIHLNIDKNTQVQNIRITPYHIISDMMQKFITTDANQVKEVHNIYDFIKNKSSILNRSRPNSTAAGVIYYYILKNKKSLTLKQFSNEVELSELTIKKIVKQIDLIYGTKLIK
jgi:transcription initiation factor TFIIIB Brf1 subunit/transcription initiation factor TFIIB